MEAILRGSKMKMKYIFFLFSFSLISELFAVNLQIIPTLGYTNYLSKKTYKVNKTTDEVLQKNIDLSSFSIGLDIVIIDDSQFTFFFNEHVSFLENSKEYGNFDIVRGRGSSLIEDVLYDASTTVGYTFFLDNFRLGIGAGVGIFGGSNGLQENSPFAAGFVMNMNIDYFFIQAFALSFGIEDGLYGSVKTKRTDVVSKMYNRFCARIGCVINF